MDYENILLTLDGSLLSEQAVQHTVTLAAPGAAIRILSIVTHGQIGLLAELARSGAYLSPVINSDLVDSLNELETEDDAHLIRDRQVYLEQVTRNLVAADYTVALDVQTGNVANAILATARDGNTRTYRFFQSLTGQCR